MKVSKTSKSLIVMERVLIIPVSLSMAFAAEAHGAEGLFRGVREKLKKKSMYIYIYI